MKTIRLLHKGPRNKALKQVGVTRWVFVVLVSRVEAAHPGVKPLLYDAIQKRKEST
jgi:hypothetical protein